MKFINFTFILLLIGIFTNGQENPIFVESPTNFHITSPLKNRSNLEPAFSKLKVNDGRASRNKIIIGKDAQTSNDWLASNPNQLDKKFQSRTPSLVFDGYTQGSNPSDPALAVGPDHVFMVFNTGFKIFDKDGNALTSDLAPSAIFGTNGCCDLTASYDNAADRWVITLLGNGALVAVSSDANPVDSEWYVYEYGQVSDYQKLSVWSDGYYMTDNTSSNNKVYAFQREKMLQGDANALIIGFPLTGLVRDGFYSPQAFNVIGGELPAPGNVPIVFMQDDAWSSVAQDHLKIWNLTVDWENPNQSTISQPTELVTTPFISSFDGGSFSNLEQPFGGTDIDALQSTIMNQAQFRKFADHNSAVFNFVVDADASGGELAAIRWYELRQNADGEPWQIYQEGTYTSPDGKHAWCGSMGLDAQGNIGMGYTAMGGDTDTYVSAFYTGRRVADPLNTMTFDEELIAQGTGLYNFYRYGDYAKLDLDPANDKQFWFTTEIMKNGIKDVVGVFQIAPNFDNDLGVVDIVSPINGTLSNNEPITVTIYNYGENPQSNFPLNLYLNGNLVATETYTANIASGENANYTFNATLNLGNEGETYSIGAETQLAADEDTSNDRFDKEVMHQYATDVGVTAILNPETGSSLGQQNIQIEITNFGAETQTNIPVYYSINSGAAVQEVFTADLAPNQSANYTFSTPYNFNQFGDYTILAGTQLANDGQNQNDISSVQISNLSCRDYLTESNMQIIDNQTITSTLNVAEEGLINDLNVTVNIEHTYLGDLIVSLVGPDGTEVVLANQVGGGSEDFENTTFDDSAETSISDGQAPFTGTFAPQQPLSNFEGLNMYGDWILNVEDVYNQDTGTLIDWTLNICSDDFMATQQFTQNNVAFEVVHKGNKQYLISMNHVEFNAQPKLEIFNMEGRILLSRKIDNYSNTFRYDLDMSYAPTGVYIVRISGGDKSASKRIVLK